MTALTCDITTYQQPLMARIRELERHLTDTLAAQLVAEQELSRMRALAAGLEAENRSLHARLNRAALRGGGSYRMDAHNCSHAHQHGGTR